MKFLNKFLVTPQLKSLPDEKRNGQSSPSWLMLGLNQFLRILLYILICWGDELRSNLYFLLSILQCYHPIRSRMF